MQMPYSTLVLSSGGVRGVAFSGAIDELVRLGALDLKHITLFVGTSIGALFAMFLALSLPSSLPLLLSL